MGEWQNRVAVITGGSTGIGLALAEALAREGMHLVLASTNEERLQQAEASLRKAGGHVIAVRCDVTDREQMRALAERTKATFGYVDLLCANAGATTAGRFADHTDSDWDWAIDVNLGGVTNAIQAFYPAMVARRSGTILLTGSQTTLVPDWVLGHGPYVAAKAAVQALAFALRAEAAEHGVNVSLLLPAATDTNIAASARRVPSDIGEMVVREGLPAPAEGHAFVLSPQEVAARAITGLKANVPIIATHASMRPLVEEYFARILAAYDTAASWLPAHENSA